MQKAEQVKERSATWMKLVTLDSKERESLIAEKLKRAKFYVAIRSKDPSRALTRI
jgi:hypothetical protein